MRAVGGEALDGEVMLSGFRCTKTWVDGNEGCVLNHPGDRGFKTGVKRTKAKLTRFSTLLTGASTLVLRKQISAKATAVMRAKKPRSRPWSLTLHHPIYPRISVVLHPRLLSSSIDTMSTPIADAGKHPKPTSHPFSKFRSKIDHLASDISRLGTAVSTTLNPNHRHDEAQEKEVDAKLEAIRDGHRFRSFAGERNGNVVKWHVDGHGESAWYRGGRLLRVSRLLLGTFGGYRLGKGGT